MIHASLRWTLDHVAHAVSDLERATQFYTKVLGFEVDLEESLPDQMVSLIFLKMQNSKMELIAPHKQNKSLLRFLNKRGEGLHHICYRVPCVKSELELLRKQGVELIDTIPRAGAYKSSIAFLHPKSFHGALVELCSNATDPPLPVS